MSCHGCATRFGLFNKEKGCPVCGFAYCSSCLRFTCSVPSLGGTQHKVCKKCFTAVSSNEQAKPETIAPPDSFLKRLEALENPSRPPITIYRQDKQSAQFKQGLSEKDLELYNRLEKLRAERRLINSRRTISVEEIERRLAVLRGQDPDIMTKKLSYTAPDTRSQQQQSDDLLKQASEELKLESQIPRPEDEIAERLNRLRGINSTSLDNTNKSSKVTTNQESSDPSLDEIAELLMKSGFDKAKEKLLSGEKGQPSNSEVDHEMDSSSDEEGAATKIVSKAKALAKLEQDREEMELDDEDDNDKSLKQEELPWCCICNEDATRRCIDCDGDLYCDFCFKEGHQDIEMRRHKTEPYRSPKS